MLCTLRVFSDVLIEFAVCEPEIDLGFYIGVVNVFIVDRPGLFLFADEQKVGSIGQRTSLNLQSSAWISVRIKFGLLFDQPFIRALKVRLYKIFGNACCRKVLFLCRIIFEIRPRL